MRAPKAEQWRARHVPQLFSDKPQLMRRRRLGVGAVTHSSPARLLRHGLDTAHRLSGAADRGDTRSANTFETAGLDGRAPRRQKTSSENPAQFKRRGVLNWQVGLRPAESVRVWGQNEMPRYLYQQGHLSKRQQGQRAGMTCQADARTKLLQLNQ